MHFKSTSYFKSLRTLEYLNVSTVVSHPVESLIAKIVYSCSFRSVICDKVLIKIKMSSFKSNKNIHKKEDGYVVSANKASSVTL